MTCTRCGKCDVPLRRVTIWLDPSTQREHGYARAYGTTNQVQHHHLCSECLAKLEDDPQVEAYMVHGRD